MQWTWIWHSSSSSSRGRSMGSSRAKGELTPVPFLLQQQLTCSSISINSSTPTMLQQLQQLHKQQRYKPATAAYSSSCFHTSRRCC
jgi:hypothetical protein